MLFCDLVGSTEISSQLDPEEWRDLAARYQRTAAEAVTRFGGHVAQYLGDGLLVYFGYPQAHDNDAERAVRGGLAILDAMAALNRESQARSLAIKLSVRVGVDTGPVVVGETGGREPAAFGDVPNVAARVQGLAQPDTVLISASVQRLVSGLFLVEERGAQWLKGITGKVELYRVLQPSGIRGRFRAAATSRGLTPFIGREDELRLLMNRWERTQDGEGQVVLIVGEAGIGKSRLVQEFRHQIAGTPHTWLDSGCEPFFENAPFYAVIEALIQGFSLSGSPEERISALERALLFAGLKLERAVPLIAPLLNLALPTNYSVPVLPPEEQRRRLIGELANWMFGTARSQPIVSVLEDLQWADASTLELIQMLVEQGATFPVLLLYAARPEFRVPWPMREHHAHITLNRLSNRQTREMVEHMTTGSALGRDVIETVVERTSGVPLFVEELTRLVSGGNGHLVAREIPATLRDSLMARLDSLGAAKDVAQVASVIGREFSYELVQAVASLPEEELRAALRKLADSELLYVHGIAPEATYLFKHVLVKDAAYEALLKSKRRDLHRTVAKVLTERFRETADARPELIARHQSEAGNSEAAMAAWQRAGEKAVDRGAFVEAEDHYSRALAELRTMPQNAGRDERELSLQIALGQVFIATRGYTGPETEAAYASARVVGDRLGNPAQLVALFRGQFASALAGGQMQPAQALADLELAAAQRDAKRATLVQAHFDQGSARYMRGDLSGAWQHLTRAIELHHEEDYRNALEDPGIEARAFLAATASSLGLADQARTHAREAVALAGRLQKPFEIVFTRTMAAHLYAALRQPVEALEFAQSAIAHGKQIGILVLQPCGVVVGWALTEQGRGNQGVALIRENLAGIKAIGYRLSIALYLGMFSEAQARVAQLEEALATADEAVSAAPDQEVIQSFPLWLRGALHLRMGAEELAEADFQAALNLAHRIGAKLYELRTATSLARMLKSRGNTAEARDLLVPLFAGFTEGFDTADLKDAKALVDELST